MANRIQIRRDTAANWTRVNPILSDGEPGLETDTNKVKYGDGTTAWASLDYASGGGGGSSDRLVNGDFNFILGPDGTVNFDPSSANGKGILQTAADLQFIAVDKTWTFGADGILTFPDSGLTIGTVAGEVQIGTISTDLNILRSGVDGVEIFENEVGFYAGNNKRAQVVPTGLEIISGDLTLSSGSTISDVALVPAGAGFTMSAIELQTNVSTSAVVGSDYITTTGFDYTNFDNEAWYAQIVQAGEAVGPYRSVPVTWAAGSTRSTGFVLVQFYGGNQFGITPAAEGGGSSDPGTWKFPATFGNPSSAVQGGILLTANSNVWKFGTDGNLTIPGEIHSAAGTGPVVVQSNDGIDTHTWTFGTNGRITFPDATVQKTAFQDVAAHVYFVHPNPGNTYTATGTINSPYNTITAAINAAVAAGHNDANCAVVILLASITENITLQPGIFLTSLGTGTHGSPNITGTVTVTSSSGNTVSNHYSISNLRIVAPSNGHCINFTGTFPQKLFVRDMWLDANGSGDCIYMDNAATGCTVQFDTGHLAHSGSGDVYCFNVVHGSCYVTDIETTGACQVAAVQAGATMTIDRSELDANGDIVVETYGSGTIVITNSSINNIKANSTGVALNDAAGVATIGNCLFNIPAGSGYSVQGATGSQLYAANNVFLTANLYRSTGITYTALPTTWLTKA